MKVRSGQQVLRLWGSEENKSLFQEGMKHKMFSVAPKCDCFRLFALVSVLLTECLC